MKRCMAGVLLAGLLLTACTSTPQAQVDLAAAQSCRIRVLTLDGGGWLDAVTNAYYAYRGDCRVEPVQLTRDEESQLDIVSTKVRSREADVVFVDGDVLAAGLLEPLDAYVQRSGLDLQPFGGLPDSLRRSGKLYDLPYLLSPEVLVLNRELLAAKQVPLPATRLTWDGFRDLTGRLTETGRYGFAPRFPERLVDLWVMEGRGGESGRPLQADELTGALQFWHGLTFGDRAMPEADRRDWLAGRVQFSPVDYFGKRQAAMTIESLDFVRDRRSRKDPIDLEVALLPTPAGTTTALTDAYTLGIAANSPHLDDAWDFLQFVVSPKGQVILARHGYLPAAQTPETAKAWLDQEPKPPASSSVLLQARWVARPRFTAAERDQQRLRYQAANQVLTGQKTVADAVQEWAAAQNR